MFRLFFPSLNGTFDSASSLVVHYAVFQEKAFENRSETSKSCAHLRRQQLDMNRTLYHTSSKVGWIHQGYILWPAKKNPPPPLKLFPVIADFFAVIKAALRYFNVCFITLFLPFPFLQILPCFSIWTKNSPPWEWPESISLA